MHLHLDLGVLYPLHSAPNFYEIQPKHICYSHLSCLSLLNKINFFVQEEAAQRQLGVNLVDATTIQIRMPDGRLQAKLNTSQTVGELRRYIRFETTENSSVWASDFEMPACNLLYVYFCPSLQENERKEKKKVLLTF
jgi:hypothetical protein